MDAESSPKGAKLKDISRPPCPTCGSTPTRQGVYPTGTERWKCKPCDQYFTTKPSDSPFTQGGKAAAIDMVRSGQSYYEVAVSFGISHASVRNWCQAAGVKSARARS